MISYSAITNYGKAVLPSVDSGLGSMNVLRDPPKSIHTRRIDKVFDTVDIIDQQEGSSDRINEMILPYSRGQNHMVKVSYSNHGNNGGQRQNGFTSGGIHQSNAKLPYTILREGAFRPPVLRQENLFPLSRLPRPWTYAFTQKGFPDFSKKLKCASEDDDLREVHREVRNTSVQAPKRSHLQYGEFVGGESDHMAAVRDCAPLVKAETQRTGGKRYGQPEQDLSSVRDSTLRVSANTHLSAYGDLIEPQGAVNVGAHVHSNTLRGNTRTGLSGPRREGDSSRDVETKRNMPLATGETNMARPSSQVNVGASEFLRLAPRPQLGAFQGRGNRPAQRREDMTPTLRKVR